MTGLISDPRSIPYALAGWCLFGLVFNGEAIAQTKLIRLVAVPIVRDSGVIADLLPDFEKHSGYQVQVTSRTNDLYQRARQGEADLVISHYGVQDMEQFVVEGFGFWPRMVFGSTVAILGPPSDPAGIRGLDAVEGFRRIAKAGAPFIPNHLPVTDYLVEILWEAAGRPDRTGWFHDLGLSGRQAVEAAAEMGAYTVWGVDPFLQLVATHPLEEEMLCVDDPILQRMMVSVVVNPERVKGVNVEGARALQRYLLAPATQARIRAYRYVGHNAQFWWPAGLQN
jgi:tungstate transport system substrate-binding protein